ncbi:hypothetical protein DVH05_016535 [Phytophthora capsici]|nr:hypothetical protein DVH05_016535 [Phytophthora capsici]
MMKLFCAIVGVAGSAFSVEVGEDQTVHDLKKKIKDKNKDDPILNNVAAKNLQLFLTKKGNGNGVKLLTQLDVVKGVMDANGFTHLQFVDTKLRAVGLKSSELGKVNDKDVAVGKGHVHVLVVLPALFSQWDPAPGQFPPLEFEDKDHVISIPAAYARTAVYLPKPMD